MIQLMYMLTGYHGGFPISVEWTYAILNEMMIEATVLCTYTLYVVVARES